MTTTRRAAAASAATAFDIEGIRAQFPILGRRVHQEPLVYLDSAATAQKPVAVLAAMSRSLEERNANIHRGVHTLSQEATRDYEFARDAARAFLNAEDRREIVFCRGATEGINLVAQSYARPKLAPGDEILVTEMEHHSNIVPWQLVCEQTGATLRVCGLNDRGELRLDEFERLLGPKTKLCAFVHISNALGTVNPVREMVAMARERGIATLVDGAQAAPHLAIDVQALGCDFYTLSGHKVYGPSGIGVLYGRAELLDAMPPYQGGGEMILRVTFERTAYNEIPFKFEAGTPNIAGAIGLGAALQWLQDVGIDAAAAHEADVLRYGTERLEEQPGVRLIGTARPKAAILSFVMDGIHPHDIGTILDTEGIAIRTGHHCAQPAMDRFGVAATARASLGIYNDRDDIDALVRGLEKCRETLQSCPI